MDPASPSQEGPSTIPPELPEGWLAQWESHSKKYYFVQRATGHSQWEVPTQPALSVPTPEPTPQHANPFQPPSGTNTGEDGTYEGADRGFMSDLAMNAIMGGKQQNKPQSGLGGLASSFLGGQSSHNTTSGSGSAGGGGGLAGQLMGSLLGGSKPQKPQSGSSSGAGDIGVPGGSSSGSHQQGGLMSLASGFLGGHQKPPKQDNSYGYSSSGHTGGSGGYTGNAPPTAYQPGQPSNQYGQSSGASQGSGQSHHHHQPHHNQQHMSHEQRPPPSYGQGPQSYNSPPQSQYEGSGPASPYSQQHIPYPPQAPPNSVASFNQYQPHANQHQYPPPPQPQHTPSYPPPGPQHTASYPPQAPQQQGPYEMYQPGPPMHSHPGHQMGQQGGYQPNPYPGQYGQSGGQAYGQAPPQSPQQGPGAYGQNTGPYGGYGGPPQSGWRP
ncbi:hypothetical protein MMC13_003625 [Lambiella insularis]|nr:hypothetical protein [Lambiella insularis]